MPSREYFRKRGPLLAFCAIVGGVSAFLSKPAESHDLSGLKARLAGSGDLLLGNVAWEPSRGAVWDLLCGRPVLFEGAKATDPLEQRDIYRAFVRLSPEGKVLGVRGRRNLTSTKDGHESELVAQGEVAVFTTRSDDGPANVTFLGLGGESRSPAAPRPGPLGSLQVAITRFLETGSWLGLARSDVFVSGEASSLEVSLAKGKVTLRTNEETVVLTARELFSPQSPIEPEPKDLTLIKRTHEPVPWLHFAANTGRHFVGTGPIAWLEGRAFTLWDLAQRTGYQVTSGPPQKPEAPTPSPVSQATDAPTEQGVWPPLPIVLPGGPADDGKWKPVKSDVLPKEKEPLFYRTLIHPDPERPYAELHLVAMDMRRLTLGIGAGYEDPHPDTGPPGTGQIPDDPQIFSRVVATFNGAFKAAHGNYGMKAEGRLLVAPVPGAATVTIDRSKSAGFGTWTKSMSSDDVVALRQNLEPLVAEGKVNPSKRKLWGDHLFGAGVAVERSALCLHTSGQLLYGWALEATGESLAQGMAMAGCTYAIHLDMNPGHCAFLLNEVQSVSPLRAKGEPLDPRMKVNPTRYIRWSPKDFFYVLRRAPLPGGKGVHWEAAPGVGPPPDHLPGIFLGRQTMGGLTVEIDRVERGRLSFALGPGTAENQRIDFKERAQPEGALIAWGLGHRTRANRPGLTLGTEIVAPLDRSFASLILEDGVPTLLPPSEPQTERDGVQIVQLPVLARNGKLVQKARELGGKRERAALCFDPAGDLYVARMTHDTPAPLAQVLVNLGCSLVVELDRGSHPPPLVERAGTERPPHTGYQQSVLYGIGRTMAPHTHQF